MADMLSFTSIMMKRETFAVADSYVPVKRRPRSCKNAWTKSELSMPRSASRTPILVRADGARFVLVEGLHILTSVSLALEAEGYRINTTTPPDLAILDILQLLLRKRSHRLGNDRQHHERSELRVMMDSLVGWLHYCVDAEWMAGIRVAVIVWKVAARYLQSDLMTWEKHIASRPDVDDVLVNLARVDR